MAGAQHFVDTARAALAPLGNGQAYQNYPDVEPGPHGETAYYGSKYADLVALKHERDPSSPAALPAGDRFVSGATAPRTLTRLLDRRVPG